MSSTGPGGSESRDERRHSIGKYVKRMRTVLKRSGSSKESTPRSSIVEGSKAAPATTTKPETTTPAPVPAPGAVASSSAAAAAPTTKSTAPAGASYSRHLSQQERARALFAKYGLTLEPHEWTTTSPAAANVQRVEKPIRMRVHRTCHRCGTTYGADKVCVKCDHKRCKKCPRYPAKKPKGAAKEKGAQKIEADDKAALSDSEIRPAFFLSVKSRQYLTVKARTEELAQHPIKQRVRRTCHKCGILFKPATATECKNCQHIRCTKCPRDPAKLGKWPNGYPGDAQAEEDRDLIPKVERTWRKPRQRVRWTCENCQTLFKEGSKTCSNCSHERCDKCTRTPPKKVKKEPDPEIVRAVEEKLAAFKLAGTPEPATTAAAA